MWCSARSDVTRPVVPRAPSWSWAAVDGEVNHDWCSLELGPRRPKILYCRVTPISPSSPFGAVDTLNCGLRLEADLARVYWAKDRQCIYGFREERTDQTTQKQIGGAHADALEISTVDTVPSVWAMIISDEQCRGLLLSRVLPRVYRRAGIFSRIWEPDEFHFERMIIRIM